MTDDYHHGSRAPHPAPGGIATLRPMTLMRELWAYIEVSMDWWFTYRTKAQVLHLAATLPDEQIEVLHCFTEGNGQLAFVELEKKVVLIGK